MIVPTYETTAKEQEIIINNQRKEIERLEQALQEEKKTTNHAYKLWKSIDNSHIEKIYKLEQKIERLNNIIKDIKGQLNYLETYSSKEDVFEDMKRRLDRIESIVNRKR